MTPDEIAAMTAEWRELHATIPPAIIPQPTIVAGAMFRTGLAYARAEAEAQRRESEDQHRAEFRAAARPVSAPRQQAIAECDMAFWTPQALKSAGDA